MKIELNALKDFLEKNNYSTKIDNVFESKELKRFLMTDPSRMLSTQSVKNYLSTYTTLDVLKKEKLCWRFNHRVFLALMKQLEEHENNRGVY